MAVWKFRTPIVVPMDSATVADAAYVYSTNPITPVNAGVDDGLDHLVKVAFTSGNPASGSVFVYALGSGNARLSVPFSLEELTRLPVGNASTAFETNPMGVAHRFGGVLPDSYDIAVRNAGTGATITGLVVTVIPVYPE